MRDITEVSKQIWEAIKNVDEKTLKDLIHPDVMFIHMGVSLSRDKEIQTLQEGKIINKEIEFQDHVTHEFQNTVILYNKIKVTAEVLGSEAINPFVVTEVYEKIDNGFRLLWLSYTRINYK